MKIEKLKYFLDLYDNGSYTKTAKLNYISQTSVTQFINSLEAEYHVKFFNRSTLPITPTEAGKAFYKKAQAIYAQYCNSLDSMKSFSDNSSLPINICYTSAIDLPILMPLVLAFKKEHPEIKVNISKSKIKNTLHSLDSVDCDMVLGILTYNDIMDNNLQSITLYEGDYVAAVSKNDPFAEREAVTSYEAFSHPLALLSQDEIGDNYNVMIDFLNSMGINPNIHINASDIDSELFMIATGNLLGFIPDCYPLNYFDDYIVKVPISDHPCHFELNLTYIPDENPSIPLFLKVIESYSKTK